MCLHIQLYNTNYIKYQWRQILSSLVPRPLLYLVARCRFTFVQPNEAGGLGMRVDAIYISKSTCNRRYYCLYLQTPSAKGWSPKGRRDKETLYLSGNGRFTWQSGLNSLSLVLEPMHRYGLGFIYRASKPAGSTYLDSGHIIHVHVANTPCYIRNTCDSHVANTCTHWYLQHTRWFSLRKQNLETIPLDSTKGACRLCGFYKHGPCTLCLDTCTCKFACVQFKAIATHPKDVLSVVCTHTRLIVCI